MVTCLICPRIRQISEKLMVKNAHFATPKAYTPTPPWIRAILQTWRSARQQRHRPTRLDARSLDRCWDTPTTCDRNTPGSKSVLVCRRWVDNLVMRHSLPRTIQTRCAKGVQRQMWRYPFFQICAYRILTREVFVDLRNCVVPLAAPVLQSSETPPGYELRQPTHTGRLHARGQRERNT